MNTRKNVLTITKTFCFIAVIFLMTACDNGFGSMHMNNRALGMDNLNWMPILIALAIGFVLGILFSRRRRKW